MPGAGLPTNSTKLTRSLPGGAALRGGNAPLRKGVEHDGTMIECIATSRQVRFLIVEGR